MNPDQAFADENTLLNATAKVYVSLFILVIGV
jgi:hypothetical protein